MSLIYWSIECNRSNEMLGIIASPLEEEDWGFQAEVAAVSEGLDYDNWRWGRQLSKAEFETYQAFGIKEIKML